MTGGARGLLVAAACTAGLSEQQAVFRARVALVRLDVAVTRGGTPVTGLTTADFQISDKGTRQRVDSVTPVNASPLSIALVLDTSGSVAGARLKALLDAIQGLLQSLRPDDRISLITFSDGIEVLVPLTRDRSTVAAALDKVHPGGATALRDAVWTAIQLLPNDDSRPLVLVFTDGIDNASWLAPSALTTAASQRGIVVHMVTLEADRNLGVPRQAPFGDQLTAASGGRRWSATSASQLRTLFTTALEEMRARYIVAFYPTDADSIGWHEVRVTVRGRAEVIAPRGYLAEGR